MKKRILALILVLMLLTACTPSPEANYNSGMTLFNKGKYTEAVQKFEAAGGFGDASLMAMYTRAVLEAEEGDYLLAFRTFESLGDYKDCPQRSKTKHTILHITAYMVCFRLDYSA